MIRFANTCLTLSVVLLTFSMTQPNACAQTEVSISDRTELIYFIGQVTNVSDRTSVINLGESHALDLIDPATGKIQEVSIFRTDGPVFRPIGTVTVIEANPTYARTKSDYSTKVQVDDVVIYVRQVSDLRNGDDHEDHVLRSAALRKKRVASRTSVERNAIATILAQYKLQFPKWERSRKEIADYFFARQDLQMTNDLEQLLKQINLFRRYHADGFQSVKAAGPEWVKAMGPLYGTDTIVKHKSATSVVQEPDGEVAPPLDVVSLRRITDRQFFDSTPQQKATAAFLVATAMRVQPRSPEQWLAIQFPQTQFPEWTDDESAVKRIRDSKRELESQN